MRTFHKWLTVSVVVVTPPQLPSRLTVPRLDRIHPVPSIVRDDRVRGVQKRGHCTTDRPSACCSTGVVLVEKNPAKERRRPAHEAEYVNRDRRTYLQERPRPYTPHPGTSNPS